MMSEPTATTAPEDIGVIYATATFHQPTDEHLYLQNDSLSYQIRPGNFITDTNLYYARCLLQIWIKLVTKNLSLHTDRLFYCNHIFILIC